jgi:hypothetical protein
MTSKRLLFFAFVWAFAVAVVVHAFDFPGSVQDFRRVTGGLELLDTKPSFDVETVHARIENYGEAGRLNYRLRLLTVDVLLPLSLTPFLFLLMRHAVERIKVSGVVRGLLLGASLVYLIFDLAENGFLFVLLSTHPSRQPPLEQVLPYLTAIKRSGTLLGLLVPTVLLAFAAIRDRLRKPALLS